MPMIAQVVILVLAAILHMPSLSPWRIVSTPRAREEVKAEILYLEISIAI